MHAKHWMLGKLKKPNKIKEKGEVWASLLKLLLILLNRILQKSLPDCNSACSLTNVGVSLENI